MNIFKTLQEHQCHVLEFKQNKFAIKPKVINNISV
jgi:hypothetical protein